MHSHTHTHTLTHTHTHIHIHILTHTRTHKYTHSLTHIHILTSASKAGMGVLLDIACVVCADVRVLVLLPNNNTFVCPVPAGFQS